MTTHTAGKRRTLAAVPGGRAILPVTEITGTAPGPRALITAGIHGGEYPGMAASMELAAALAPEDVAGTLTIIHAANPCAFWARRPELNEEDGKNLNREFPGDPRGTSTERLAHLLMDRFIRRADFYIDCHSGDIHEDLCPHVYYSKACAESVSRSSRDMALAADVPYMVPSIAQGGAYNCGAAAGVPSILIEHGGNGLCTEDDVAAFRRDLVRILRRTGVLTGDRFPAEPMKETPREVKKVLYVMAEEDSCWRTALRQGDPVKKGDILGRTTNLFGDERRTYRAEEDGVLLYINTSFALLKGKVAAAYVVM